MRRTVTVPVFAVVALGVVLVLVLLWMAAAAGPPTGLESGGLTGPGGTLDRVLPGGAPLFERAPAGPAGPR